MLPFEILLRKITSLNITNFNKECVKSRLLGILHSSFKHVFKISDKNLSREDVKAWNKDLAIQKADEGNHIVVLNRSYYISKLSKIVEDTSKFKRVTVEEGKAVKHLIHMEERIICLNKSLEDQDEISGKEKNLYSSGSKPRVLYGLAKILKALEDGIPSFCTILLTIGTSSYK